MSALWLSLVLAVSVTAIRDEAEIVRSFDEYIPLRTCVKLLSTSRRATDDGDIVAVNYLERETDVAVKWLGAAARLEASSSRKSGRVMATSVNLTKKASIWSELYIRFTCAGLGSSQQLEFRMKDATDEHLVLHNISVPTVSLQYPDEIVYPAGQDVALKVKTEASYDQSEPDFEFEMTSSLFDAQTGEFEEKQLTDFYESYVVGIARAVAVKIKTSEHAWGGVIAFSCRHPVGGNLVASVSVTNSVIIRPSNTQHPFSPTFVGVIRFPFSETLGPSATSHKCSVKQLCTLTFEVIGENPWDQVLIRSDYYISYRHLAQATKYSQSVTLMFDHTTLDNGRVALETINTSLDSPIHTFQVYSYRPLQILKGRTYIGYGNKKLNITCTVKGRPQPEVFITLLASNAPSCTSCPPDTINELGHDTFGATKILPFDLETRVDASWCEALGSSGPHDAAYEYFELPVVRYLNLIKSRTYAH